MPAEWEKHKATWLSWPKNTTTFPNGALRRVESLYIEMIDALSEGEIVNVLVDDESIERRIASVLRSQSNARFLKIKSADVWVRDYGPIFVKMSDGKTAATKWKFNAWGNKYDDLIPDDRVGLSIAELGGAEEIVQPGIILEGGSIDVNGRGSLLTTKQCLLNSNRNPDLSFEKISNILKRFLGVTNLIWLESGISGDDTDGHVDDIARFVSDDTILCAFESKPVDENYRSLKQDYECLLESHDQDQRELKVVPLPMPKKKVEFQGERLPASYSNFYIGNAAVLVPFYDDPNDDVALGIIRKFFPSRKVIGIESTSLVLGFGSIHCVTQQEPA
jgi:agmatine deiminase